MPCAVRETSCGGREYYATIDAPCHRSYTDRDLADIKRMYDQWQMLKHLQLAFIHEHAMLAPGVSVTRYENGEEVLCNASGAEYEGVPSMGFALRKTSVKSEMSR